VLVDGLVEHVRDALLDAFSFDARGLIQPVAASEVVRIAQAVSGVTAIELTTLCFADAEQPAVQSTLVANQAHVDATSGQVVPAELLLLDSDHLRVEVVQ
jgi:hypothetical protein